MKVELFVDDEREPRATFEPPGTFELDTQDLEDGPHTLTVRAGEESGARGLERIPFTVRNGPGIAILGLREGETVRGRISLLVNAYASRIGDEFEPVRAETPAPVPTWAWVLSLVVAAWAMYYSVSEYREYADQIAAAAPLAARVVAPDSSGSAVPGPPASTALGEQVFGNYCAACHQLSGEGLPGVFPPLRGDAVVLADDPDEHIRTILEGLAGKQIDGVAYASPMPPLAAQLTDDEVAAVVNHERSSWENEAPRVTAANVAAVRASPRP